MTVPIAGILETALEHNGDLGIDLGDPVEHSVDIFGYPCGTIVGQNSRSTEQGHALLVVVGWFVQGCNGIGLWGTRALNEVDNFVNGLQGVIQGSLVMEPVPMAHCFSDGQAIKSSGERMNINNYMHPIVRDSIVRNVLQVSRLVPRVQLRAGQIDPRRVVGGNPQDSHPTLRQTVDILGGDEGGIAMLEDRTTSGTQVLAESPLIRRIATISSPEVTINVGPLDEPAAQVDAIGLEGAPVDVIGVDEGRDGTQGGEKSPSAHSGRSGSRFSASVVYCY